jgi:hypothetical protein
VTPTQDIKLNVEPNGTRVYLGDKELGKDLVTISLEEGQTLEVEIRRDGYVTKKQIIDGSKPQLSVRLERDRSAPRPSGNPRTPPPAGSGKKNAYDGVVDPWKDPPKK